MLENNKVPKTRGRLNDLQRKEICEYAQRNPNTKHHKIAQKFMKRYEGLKLDRSTVSKILKNREQYKNIKVESVAENQFRHRPVKFPRLELAMRTWVQQIVAANMLLSDYLLKEKGIEFACALDIKEEDLSFSSSWITKFKKRNQLCRITTHGESENAPLESLPGFRLQLQEVTSRYHPDDIYNADETGLFVACFLTKHSVIGVDMEENCIFRSQKRKILLIVDNAPSRISLNSTDSEGVSSTNALTNVTVHYLLPNTTSHMQPMNAGIIKSFKSKYKRHYTHHVLELFKKKCDLEKDPIVADFASDLELYYKLVDEPSTTEDAMNDKEILAMVHRTFDPEPAATDSEEDEVSLAPPVNLSEAINALQLLIQFQEQKESDDRFKPKELNMLRKKMYHFEKLKNGAKKQTDLFHYFGDTENLFEIISVSSQGEAPVKSRRISIKSEGMICNSASSYRRK
ncbi:8355_t:CDS:2 [Gigaspora rosea]|nr:8355_t:CDS:2 [Gigaspora rosea]